MKLEKETHRTVKDGSSKSISMTLQETGNQNVNLETSNRHNLDNLDDHTESQRYENTSCNIDEIRTRLTIREHKKRVSADVDPVWVIRNLHSNGHFTDFEKESLMEISQRCVRTEAMLHTILSKDDVEPINHFMTSLLDTEQRSLHNFILDSDDRGELHMIIKRDIPRSHASGFDVIMKMEIETRPDLHDIIFDSIDKEERFGEMRVYDKAIGSVIIHLKPDTPNAGEQFAKAYYNGTLRKHIEDLLQKAGILEELIKDQVKVVVNISVAESGKTTIYDKHWDFLLEEMSPKLTADMLLRKGVLNQADMDDIFRIQTRLAQANTLLIKLKAKGNSTVADFKECLEATSQNYISQKLQETPVDDIQEEQKLSEAASMPLPTAQKETVIELKLERGPQAGVSETLTIPLMEGDINFKESSTETDFPLAIGADIQRGIKRERGEEEVVEAGSTGQFEAFSKKKERSGTKDYPATSKAVIGDIDPDAEHSQSTK